MTAKIIAFAPSGDKARGPISVDVVLKAGDSSITGHLSNLEREVVKYELADQVAYALRTDEPGGVSKGHRTALYAHLVSIMHKDGPDAAVRCMILAASMAGLETRVIPPDEEEPEGPYDPTDWDAIGF